MFTKNRQKYDLSIPKPNDFSLYALWMVKRKKGAKFGACAISSE